MKWTTFSSFQSQNLDTVEHNEIIQARLKKEEFRFRFFAGTPRGDHTIATYMQRVSRRSQMISCDDGTRFPTKFELLKASNQKPSMMQNHSLNVCKSAFVLQNELEPRQNDEVASATLPNDEPSQNDHRYPLHAHVLCADHLGGEGVPRAAQRCGDHELRLRAGIDDGEVRSSPWQVHGVLKDTSE